MALNISINEFVNNWIPPHIKWDIMSYVLECPFKKELQEGIKDMIDRRVRKSMWFINNDLYEYAKKKQHELWLIRLNELQSRYNIYRIFNSPHLFVNESWSPLPSIKFVKKWLTENKVKGRSQFKGVDDWDLAVKLIMSVQ